MSSLKSPEREQGHRTKHRKAHVAGQAPVVRLWDNIILGLTDPAYSDPVRASLFEHGASRAAIRILVAVVLNHIRRVLVPWLGQFLWHHAVADLRAARSSPGQYLEGATTYGWLPFAAWMVSASALPRVRGFLRRAALHDGTGDGWAVLYLATGLITLEAAYTRTCWTFAQLYAYAALFAGGVPEHDLLERTLTERPAKITAQLGLVLGWLVYAVLPVIATGLEGRWARLVGHGAVWGGTAYVVKHSDRFFLALEMSDVLVTLTWMVCGMVFAGMEALGAKSRSDQQVNDQPEVLVDTENPQ